MLRCGMKTTGMMLLVILGLGWSGCANTEVVESHMNEKQVGEAGDTASDLVEKMDEHSNSNLDMIEKVIGELEGEYEFEIHTQAAALRKIAAIDPEYVIQHQKRLPNIINVYVEQKAMGIIVYGEYNQFIDRAISISQPVVWLNGKKIWKWSGRLSSTGMSHLGVDMVLLSLKGHYLIMTRSAAKTGTPLVLSHDGKQWITVIESNENGQVFTAISSTGIDPETKEILPYPHIRFGGYYIMIESLYKPDLKELKLPKWLKLTGKMKYFGKE